MGKIWRTIQGKKRHIGAAIVLLVWLLQHFGVELPDSPETAIQVFGGSVYGIGVADRALRWLMTGK
jgi:hypothetical protein